MYRTTIVLPQTLKAKLQKVAQKENLSFGALVRQALEKYLYGRQDPYMEDSFFTSTVIIDEDVPADASLNHDKYLYEDEDPHE